MLYGTPLLFAALGELLAERSGVLNLGVEGMMLVGAVMGFWAVQRFEIASAVSLALALGVAAVAGAAMALIHAYLVITLRSNQIVSGLALTIFAGAAGLSAYLGNDLDLSGAPAEHAFPALDVLGLGDLADRRPDRLRPVGTRLSSACVLDRPVPRPDAPGPNVRAVGESPAAADAMGIDVTAYRYVHTVVGGALAGVGGACFSLQATPQWVAGVTGGSGWIAVALVIFAFWRRDLLPPGRLPLRRVLGATADAPSSRLAQRGSLGGVPVASRTS